MPLRTSKQGARQRQQRQCLSQTERILQVSTPLAAAQLLPPPLQHPGQDLTCCSPRGILHRMSFLLQIDGMQFVKQSLDTRTELCLFSHTVTHAKP